MTKEPISAFLFLTVASSIFLTKLAKVSSVSRAKIATTGLPPLAQTRQEDLPASGPVTCCGLNARTDSPTAIPDLTSADAGPLSSSTPAAAAARNETRDI